MMVLNSVIDLIGQLSRDVNGRCQLTSDVIGYKTLKVIGAFRSVFCHSLTIVYCWSNCRLSSNSIVNSFA